MMDPYSYTTYFQHNWGWLLPESCVQSPRFQHSHAIRWVPAWLQRAQTWAGRATCSWWLSLVRLSCFPLSNGHFKIWQSQIQLKQRQRTPPTVQFGFHLASRWLFIHSNSIIIIRRQINKRHHISIYFQVINPNLYLQNIAGMSQPATDKVLQYSGLAWAKPHLGSIVPVCPR